MSFFAFALILVFANVSILFGHTGPGCLGLNPMAQYFKSGIIRKGKLNCYYLKHTDWHYATLRISKAIYF